MQATAVRVIRASPAARYTIAVVAAGLAVALRLGLDPVWGLRLPYITLFPAIMLSAWLGGLGPGVLTTLLCAVAAEYFWIEPDHSWTVNDPTELLGLSIFIAIGVVMSGLNEAWRRGTAAVVESEQRLNVTLTSIGDAVITTDDRGYVARLNPMAERLTGWKAADAIGRPLHDVFVIVNEHSRQPAQNPVYRVLHEGAVTGLANHTLLVAKDGSELPIDDSAAPIRGEDGQLTGVVMVFRDVTERRRAERNHAAALDNERALRTETERVAGQLRIALDAGRMGTWQYTIGTAVVQWSPGLEAIHGLAPGTFPGTFEAFRAEIHPDDRDRVLAAIGAAIEQGREHHIEYRIVRADGAVRWVEGRGQLFRDEHGRPDRMVGVCLDITDRRELDEERAQLLVREQAARTDVERASRLKDEFLAVLSHELRTPLNAVLGYTHLLASGLLPPDRASHALDAIQRNARAQARLVESLLDLSRIMAGKLELDASEQDIRALVDAAADVVRPEAEARGLTLAVDAPPSPIALTGDGARLQQVFWNLLSNAVKFTPTGGHIAVRVTATGSDIVVQVTDTGQGISADFLPQVFDRFKQADADRRRAPAGLGLGLALVREMVQAHGGTVRAESPGEGRGSTFTVTLPIRPAGLAASTGDAGPPPDPVDALAEMDILVVDDDADVRDLLALLLESRGAAVRAVSSAGEALDAIGARRPNVLLADLRMPGQDGYTLIHMLRAQEREQSAGRLPAIAVTAYASPRDREQALAAGYDAHVTKPVDAGDLTRAIARVAGSESV